MLLNGNRCFLPNFSLFGWGVSSEKIKMWKVNGRQTMDGRQVIAKAHIAFGSPCEISHLTTFTHLQELFPLKVGKWVPFHVKFIEPFISKQNIEPFISKQNIEPFTSKQIIEPFTSKTN
jgi:hypothetical protein